MISINTLLWLFMWGVLTLLFGIFVTNWETLTVPLCFVWAGIALCAVTLLLLVNHWVCGALSRHRSRNKKSEPREHTHES